MSLPPSRLCGLLLAACTPNIETTTELTGTSAPSTDVSTSSTSEVTTTGEASSTAETSPTDGTSATTSVLPEECACGDIECGTDLCGIPVKWYWDTNQLSDEAALDCTLTALRDRTPGRLQWAYIGTNVAYHRIVWILPDGNAVRDRLQYDDCMSTGPRRYGSLASPGLFDACLAEPDLEQRFNCLDTIQDDNVVECAPMDSNCWF